ncbi:MAG TPA: DUF5996 family protein [Caldimonas sp.]|jgi:hypothetical protein|nr:DUF5996 family protein [Caldimonas sp.]HEX2539668.1 DUF5996 family protein [Caldimonas sp.]
MPTSPPRWPALDYAAWSDTATTLQLWTQIVGKVRLALSPWLNHGWHVPLYVGARGLGSSPIHAPAGPFEIDLDLVSHRLVVRSAWAAERGFALAPMSVARFHERLMAELAGLGIEVRIDTVPNEVADPIPFPRDETHASYDAAAVHAFWRALVEVDRVFRVFRTSFLGKSSPVHFFWGSFDLAVTRFSGRPAPLHPGGIPGLPDAVTREAYSHEVSSAGFWPGSAAYPRAAFYSYAYPTPAGFAEARIEPDAASWSAEMGEWLLPYEAVRSAADPNATLLRFLHSSYRAAAELAHWPADLECDTGVPRRPRALPLRR